VLETTGGGGERKRNRRLSETPHSPDRKNFIYVQRGVYKIVRKLARSVVCAVVVRENIEYTHGRRSRSINRHLSTTTAAVVRV